MRMHHLISRWLPKTMHLRAQRPRPSPLPLRLASPQSARTLQAPSRRTLTTSPRSNGSIPIAAEGAAGEEAEVAEVAVEAEAAIVIEKKVMAGARTLAATNSSRFSFPNASEH
jgi:hypothetical protein